MYKLVSVHLAGTYHREQIEGDTLHNCLCTHTVPSQSDCMETGNRMSTNQERDWNIGHSVVVWLIIVLPYLDLPYLPKQYPRSSCQVHRI